MPVTYTDRTDSVRDAGSADVPAGGRLAGIQRSRMVEAVASVAAEIGVGNLTVAHVVSRAGVSRRTFYELFEDCEDCVLAAFDDGVARAWRRLERVNVASVRWQDRIRARLLALLQFFDEEPALARFLLVESLAAGAKTLALRQRLNAVLVQAIDEAREHSPGAREAPVLSAEGAVGAATAVIHARLVEDSQRPLVELVNPLMSMLVLPFLGTAAARRELERPAPAAHPDEAQSLAGSLGKLDMRLTYRTVRVLAAVATKPGSSNRVIGEGSGISDQGQISKLLRRLQRLGLVENVLKARLRGEPNSWTLTEKGWQVHGSIRAQNGSS
jgi:AcrR family transcriptional regulator